MKIGFMSDVHVDLGMRITDMYNIFNQNIDILIIAGDIGRPTQTVSFIDMLLDTFNATIIFVPGNHDYYNYNNLSVEDVNSFYKDQFINDDVHVLVHGESINIHGVNFVGATLWSDLAYRYNPTISVQTQISAKNAITDFEMIAGMHNAVDMRDQYEKDRNGIINSLTEINDMDNTVVITHFSPSIEFRNEDYRIDPLAYYFCGYMDDVIQHMQPKHWIYGHTHGRNDMTMVGGTTIHCNQIYGNEIKMKIIEM